MSGRTRFGAAVLGVLAIAGLTAGAGVATTRGFDWPSESAPLRAQRLEAPALAHLTVASAPRGIPSAALFGGSPTVGVLMYARGRDPRICTAAVLDSPAGNLVVTAAHCVDGSRFATDLDYVPGYRDGKAPYGVWPVRAITVPSGWQNHHDSDLDLAFLTVAAVHGRQVQAVTGGLAVGFNLGYGQKIEAVAYNDRQAEPVRCATRGFLADVGQLEFLCNGFFDGTSGAPWIAGYDPANGAGALVGVLGGYYGGGIYEWASYSPYLGSELRVAYEGAELRSAAIARGQRASNASAPD